MYQFRMRPVVKGYDSFEEFSRSEEIGPEDLLFTQKFLWRDFMRGTSAQTLFIEEYGVGEPSDVMIDAMLREVATRRFRRMIAIGGGTVLDAAKILCLDGVTSTAGAFESREEPGRSRGLVMLPTTCGTGCEMTGVTVVDFPSRGAKIGKRFESGFADSAVLIGELLRGLPYDFFIYSVVDALIHALEIYLSPVANDHSDVFCVEAIRRILSGCSQLVLNGPDKRGELLDHFLIASNFAGIALANIVCGGVHAMAMHFGSTHHVPHGESNSRFLMGVFKIYAQRNPDGKLRNVARIIAECLGGGDDIVSAFAGLEKMLDMLVPKKKLVEYGMRKEDAPLYADKVIATQQRLLVNNYVPLSREDLIGIYESAC